MTNTNTNKRIPKRVKFEKLLEIEAVKSNPELVEFITHEIELLTKKNVSSSSEKKPTKTQKENDLLKSKILEEMTEGTLYTITNMLNTFECLKGLTHQKVNSIVKQMYFTTKPTIERIEDKRSVYFKKL